MSERAPRLSRDERRRMLLEAAEAIIERRGVGACTLDAIATEAGVAKSLPYAYFASIDDVLVTVFDDVIGSLDEGVSETVVAGLDDRVGFAVILERALARWFEEVGARGRLIGALLDGGGVPALREAVQARDRRSDKLWHDVCVDLLGLDDPDADVLSSLINRGATGLIDLWVVHGRSDRFALTASYVAAMQGAARELRGR